LGQNIKGEEHGEACFPNAENFFRDAPTSIKVDLSTHSAYSSLFNLFLEEELRPWFVLPMGGIKVQIDGTFHPDERRNLRNTIPPKETTKRKREY
jgi:hypothetical protein